jgi:hypothetical protein
MIPVGLGYAGTTTSGYPNTKSTQHRPDISGSEFGSYKQKNSGIKINKRRARKKTQIKNPRI